MLRIHQSKSAAQARSYYATSDYYAKGNEQELIGEWAGKAAAMLGLSGTVDKVHFDRLTENLDPFGPGTLTQAQRGNRTVGYDFNFNAPKSLSVLYGLTQDSDLLTAFRQSVNETMQTIESEMKTRVRKGKQQRNRTTGNMVWAEFVHFTARPVEGISDPNLHSHCFAFNVTQDGVENEYKAGQFRDLKRDACYFEALFHSRLAGRLTDLGYGVVRQGRFWEIEGVPQTAIRRFSRRSELLEAKAKELGISNANTKAALAASTRENKRKDLTWDELRQEWSNRLEPHEQAALTAVHDHSYQGRESNTVTPRDALRHAAKHVFERDSVVREKQLLEEALRYGVGSIDLASIQSQFGREGIIQRTRDEERLVTSHEVLNEERAMLDFGRSGRGVCKPLAPEHRIRRDWLNADQRAAVRHVLASTDRVMMIRGLAGVGKTKLTLEALEALSESGKSVVVVAPTAQASRVVLREEGVPDADTLQRLLIDPEYQERLKNGVLWIDEAGLVGNRDMSRAFAIAKEQNARVVLVGDYRQHRSVARGEAMRLLESSAGIEAAEVKDIRRQKGEYKAAVAAFAEGNTQTGFDKLDRLGWVVEGVDGAHHQLAVDYADAIGRGEKTLVISPTHAEGEQVTTEIRQELQRRNLIGLHAVPVERLVSLNLTEAQRADASSYQ